MTVDGWRCLEKSFLFSLHRSMRMLHQRSINVKPRSVEVCLRRYDVPRQCSLDRGTINLSRTHIIVQEAAFGIHLGFAHPGRGLGQEY